MGSNQIESYNSKMTAYVFACWILAAFGGLMFGYDIGISGGVTSMDDFLIKFFPNVHERKMHAYEDNYCKYDDHMLQLFTSSLKLFKRSAIPALIVSNAIQMFQQFTGINAIMFYAPVLFQTLGFGADASLLSSVITGLVNVFSTFVSVFAVDKVGRRKLLLQACVQMFISQVAIGGILLVHLKPTGSLDKFLAGVVVVLVCTYVMSFAWSWGPMGWLIPSEIYPIETRTAGFAVAVSSNMIFTFIIAQAFLSMLCHMKAYIFFFFAAWIVVMGLFVLFLLPETKGVPIELVEERLWKKHPVWKRFFRDEAKGEGRA
ncbi:Sugar transport protein 13 [Striga hermonthica]|uniref:Sugar transport protein 13 n=1 Tax=Striga hermonthica TaxID=68872 RepID=A0A9N7MNW1_STRHE|nr:Sugar transport protein 13 [Striga hermonthica]